MMGATGAEGRVAQRPTGRLRVGDLVEVRSPSEILDTLDPHGDLGRLPFMPEMAAYAGRRFRVSASAHKTCDTVRQTGGRRLDDAVHLADLRCDGSAHGRCEAGCLLFWKSAWLRKVDEREMAESAPCGPDGNAVYAALSRHAQHATPSGAERYRCQATQLYDATSPLAWWDVRQYWRDVASGNVRFRDAARVLVLAVVYNLRRMPFGYRFFVGIYDFAHRLLTGRPDPYPRGKIPEGQPTPDVRLDLSVGEIVTVRGKSEIESTINAQGRNRGMRIDVEEMPYCGQRHAVAARVKRIVNEQTGELMVFKNPCIVLENVYCRGEYSENRLLCPRRILSYWREAWLERAGDAPRADRS
jgi:hypothetical protein